jgi:hypothetical protein
MIGGPGGPAYTCLPKLETFQISTLVLSFSTIAFFEDQSERPSP